MKKGLFVFLCLLMPSMAFAETSPKDTSGEQKTKLLSYDNEIKVVTNLNKNSILDDATFNKCVSSLLAEASKLVGRESFTVDEFNNYLTEMNSSDSLGTFLNIIRFVFGVFFVVGVLALAGFYFGPLLINTPIVVWELIAYGLTALLIGVGFFVAPFNLWFLTIKPISFSIPGLLLLPFCITFTDVYHSEKKSKIGNKKAFFAVPRFLTYNMLICSIVGGAMSVLNHMHYPDAGVPYITAFLSMMYFHAFLGFSFLVVPGCVAVGWSEDDKVVRSTVAALFLMLAYLAMNTAPKIFAHDGVDFVVPSAVLLFQTGCLWTGTFVYYLGLLYMASKAFSWKATQSFSKYALMQIITVISGVAALYLGSVYGVSTLLGIGGTFFAFYLFEKYYEIPWKGVGWAWSVFGLAVAGYFFIGFASQYPQYFLWNM